MSKRNSRNTKGKIVNAAWKLFYEQGYEDTTIEEIVEISCTSRGSFYHYFEGKDALLSSLSYLFDEKYEDVTKLFTDDMTSIDKLIFMNHELFFMIENSISIDLLARLYSSQLITRGDKHLLDTNRTYYKLIRHVVIEGIEKGELRDDVAVNEITKAYALFERALLYDWCICNGDYSLYKYSEDMLPRFLEGYKSIFL
jgi:AcrR family transcriptional regulator